MNQKEENQTSCLTEKELEAFVHRSGRRLQKYIERKIEDPFEAENCYYDTLAKLWYYAYRFRGEDLYYYAKGIAEYEIIAYYRKKKHFDELHILVEDCSEMDPADDSFSGFLAGGEAYEYVEWRLDYERAIQTEKERTKRILKYREKGYKIAEIAEKMNLTQGQVQMIIRRFRERYDGNFR